MPSFAHGSQGCTPSTSPTATFPVLLPWKQKALEAATRQPLAVQGKVMCREAQEQERPQAAEDPGRS